MADEALPKEEPVPCLNRCGYYGSDKYLGFCSKCYKEMSSAGEVASQMDLQMRGRQSSRPPVTVESSTKPDSVGASSLEGKSFLSSVKKKKIDPKQSQQKLSTNTVKPKLVQSKQPSAIMSNLTSFLGKKPQRPAQHHTAASQSGSKKFQDFLSLLKNPSLKDFFEYLNGATQKITRGSVMTPDEYSHHVQELYETIRIKYRDHQFFRDFSEEDWEVFMDGVEKALMSQLYGRVFDLPSSEEFGKDWLLSHKIALLWWVEPQHLDITLALDRPDVTHLIETAKHELLRMDYKKAPLDKLTCLSRCCDLIFSALKASNDGPASADDFLPAIIYLILVTNPPRLHANLNYIERFSCPGRVTSGETGYYLTNLVGTVAFIERVSFENLNITEDEYNRKMGIDRGETILDAILACDYPKRNDKKLLGEVEDKLQEMKSWATQQHLLQVEASEWRQEMAEFREGIRDQIENTMLGTPNMIHWGPT